DWHIHPHQHADLVQVLYVQHGHATLEIEGRELSFRQPALQVVPPLCVHGFRFAEDVNGFILSLALPLVEDSAQTLGTRLLTSPHCHLLEHDDQDRKSTRLNSSHVKISYAVFCLKKK